MLTRRKPAVGHTLDGQEVEVEGHWDASITQSRGVTDVEILDASTLTEYPMEIQKYMASEGFVDGTPVQMACWRTILKGQNCRAMSQPGTGKTLAFLLPIACLLHSESSLVPRALIFVPTRELADQIFTVCKKLWKLFKIKTVSACGGVAITQQIKEIQAGVDVVVATPGRMVELLVDEHITLGDLKIIILDEADKMLSGDLGRQMDGLKHLLFASNIPQVCAFSATFPEAFYPLLQAWLGEDAISLSFIADARWVSPNITQIVHVCAEHKKMIKLKKHLSKIDAEHQEQHRPRILIFANTIKKVRAIHKELEADRRVVMLHGKRTPSERNSAMNSFRSGKVEVLVATDVAGRGLDIKNLPYVVNYDFPTRLETYIHRIGRTGRLASNGHAYGFFTRNLAPMTADLIQLLQHHNQWIDPNLLTLSQSYQEAQTFMQSIQEIERANHPSTDDQQEDQKQDPQSTQLPPDDIKTTGTPIPTSSGILLQDNDVTVHTESSWGDAMDHEEAAEGPVALTEAVLDEWSDVRHKPSKRGSSHLPVYARKKPRS